MLFNKLGRTTVIAPLAIILIFAAITLKNPAFIDESLETLLLDYRFKIRNLISPPEAPEDIVIVAIGEKSLEQYGRWPWSRKLQAKLIEKIFEDGPKVVAVDVFYPERESPEADRELAEVIGKHRDRLVAALGFDVNEELAFVGEINNILYDHSIQKIQNLKFLRSVESFRVLLPPEPIAGSATFGHVYSLPDRDGKLRWENMYIKYGDEYFPSLALQTARIANNIAFEKLSIAGGQGVDLDGLWIPTDEFGRLLIKYIGKEGSFQYISAADVLSGSSLIGYFRDKIVLIGTTAIGAYDQKVTPFSVNMPGVEKNATVAANIINMDFMKRAPLYLDLFVVLISGAAALLPGRRKKAVGYLIFYACLIVFLIIANQAAFNLYSIWVNLTYPLLTVMSIAAFLTSYRYLVEEKKARNIRIMFSSYVTEKVVNELIKNPEMAKLGGERKQVTVLFSDIRGFTTFSEGHEPEEVVAILNEYLTAMTDIVFRWEGTLDKFIGDAIVAFWGAPLEQVDHSERAVRCALHMIKRLEELREKWISEGRVPLSIGIGLNAGEVIVGNIGAEGKKMDYTVIGDHVNIGARIESLTRKFETDILFSASVFNNIKEHIEHGRIGHVSIKDVADVIVKGKEKSVKIYEITALKHDMVSMIDESSDEEIIRLKEK